jgi:hypothetical protein
LKKQFGFIADPNKSICHNTAIQLATMPTWFYFNRPSHLAFHDFTRSKQTPKNLRSLLGLGLKFIPTLRLTNKWTKLKKTTFERLHRNIQLRFFFADKNSKKTNEEIENYEDNDTHKYNPKLHITSTWTPPPWTYPKKLLQERMDAMDSKLKSLFKARKGKTNLLAHQSRALKALQNQQDFIIAACDKNLGPAIIETEDYIKLAIRDHLSCTKTYRQISIREATVQAAQLETAISQWISNYKNDLSAMERKFLRTKLAENENPFARFYLTLKAHKLQPGQHLPHLKSRPIVSCPGSLLHPLGSTANYNQSHLAKQHTSKTVYS